MSDKADKEAQAKQAMFHLREDARWLAVRGFLEDRRDGWKRDLASPQIYQNHPELASTAARMAELDWLLDFASDAKPDEAA